MKQTNLLCAIATSLLITACNSGSTDRSEQAEKEILQAEKDFAEYVKQHGMTNGFTEFAAEDAVMNHGDSLVRGKTGIQNYYEMRKVDGDKLEWEADFVDAASSGELGYTFGHYTYTKFDSTGKPSVYNGTFHSVWKKQKDGKWKFVWD